MVEPSGASFPMGRVSGADHCGSHRRVLSVVSRGVVGVKKMVKKSITWAAVILIAGCHGTALRFGTGHTLNDMSGSGGFTDADDHGGGSGAFNFEQDDSTSAWVELEFQLTPQAIMVENHLPLLRNTPRPTPPDTQVILEQLAAIENRLSAIEEETGDHISWADIGVGGGTAGSGVGLLWLAWAYWRRRRQDATD